MSYKDGWAALNLEMPARVPRTEYSLNYNHALVSAVSGIQIDEKSPGELISKAVYAAMQKWNFDFQWNTLVGSQFYNGMGTDMGHAVYANDGSDLNRNVRSTFSGDLEEVYNLQPAEAFANKTHGELTDMFSNAYKNACAWYPDAVNMTGTYTTAISGLLALLGWDLLLLALGSDSERFGALTNRYADWMQKFYDAMADSSAECIMIHDDMVWNEGAFINPAWYRKYVFPNIKKYIAPLREAKKKVIFTADGNYTEFIDDLAEAGVSGFVMEPTTDMAYIAEKYGRTHSFIGNADTRILMFGSREDIYGEVLRCMDIGKKCPGFFMAVGNHLSPNTPVENALYYNEVYEKLSKR